jgi:hypothetical protein
MRRDKESAMKRQKRSDVEQDKQFIRDRPCQPKAEKEDKERQNNAKKTQKTT